MMSNKTYYFLRHGLATRREDGYGPDILTAKLLPEGIVEAEKSAWFLKDLEPAPEVAFASPVLRCQQTAEIVTRVTSWTFITDDRLREFHQETIAELSERAQSWLAEVEQLPTNVILACTHGSVIAALREAILGSPLTEANVYDYPAPAGIVKINQGGAVVLRPLPESR